MREPNHGAITMVFEFWYPHSQYVEERLRNGGIQPASCAECMAQTFNPHEGACEFCGGTERGYQCPRCESVVRDDQRICMDEIGPDGALGLAWYCDNCIGTAS